MSTVGTAVVGVGMMAQTCHIPAFQRAEGCHITGLASARPELLGRVADRFQIAKRYASHAEVAADPEVSLGVVIVPPEYNVQICLDLLEAGKHVICEKPVALCATDAQRLADAAARNDRQLMVGFMKRHDAGVHAARDTVRLWLDSGEAGALLMTSIHAFIGGDWTANVQGLFPVISTDEPVTEKPAGAFPEWLPEAEKANWGPFYFFNHVHSHDVDLLNYFLGAGAEVRYADWSEGARVVVLEAAGQPVTFTIGGPMPHNRWDEEVKIYFEHGWVHVKLPPPMLINSPAQVEVYRMGEQQELCDVRAPYSWSFLRQAQNAVDVARGAAVPLCTIADGVEQLRLTEAIYREGLQA